MNKLSIPVHIWFMSINKLVNKETGTIIQLKTNDKLVFNTINLYNGYELSIDKIGYSLGLSNSTVKRSINTLEKLNIVKCDNSHRFTINVSALDNYNLFDINENLIEV